MKRLDHEPGRNDILYFVTGFKKNGIGRGFGHAGETLAIRDHLPPEVSVTYSAWADDPFFTSQLTRPNEHFTLVDITRSSGADQPRDEQMQYFLTHNEDLKNIWADTKVIITDFFAEARVFEQYEARHRLRKTPIMGVYHSFADRYPVEDPTDTVITDWQQDKLDTIQAMDAVILTDPFRQNEQPFYRENTKVFPVPPIVRPVTRTKEEVRSTYGIDSNSTLIVVYGEDTPRLARDISKITDTDTSFLVWGCNDGVSQELRSRNVTFFNGYVPDLHNVIAASDGVIAKPGMSILMECLVSRIPLLFSPPAQSDGERRIKVAMLQKATGHNIPVTLRLENDIVPQLSHWLTQLPTIKEHLSALNIRSDGAKEAANVIVNFLSQSTK